MTHILYLAGGSSRRFGENKLLYPLDGRPLYRHGLDMLAALVQTRRDCTLALVSRYDAVLDGARACGVRAVYSSESEKGQSYTIRAGLDALDLQPDDFVAFVVADQPYLTARTMARLLDAARPGVACARVCFGGRCGSPTLFSAALAPGLYALRGDEGGRALLQRPDCVRVPADSARELLDIDTPDSLRQAAE